MKITGRRLANNATHEYVWYRRVKKFAKKFATRSIRRHLNREI